MNCLICTQRYRAGEYCPRILPCSHTFCSKCISKLLVSQKKNKQKTTCPFCRQEYKAESVANLIVNRDLLEVSEKQGELARRNPLSYPVWKETVWRDTVDYHLGESRTAKTRIGNRISRNMETINSLMSDAVGFKDLVPRLTKRFLTWFDYLEATLDRTNNILNHKGYLMKFGNSGLNDGRECPSSKSFEEFTVATRSNLLLRYIFIEEAPNVLSNALYFMDFLNATSYEPPSLNYYTNQDNDDDYDDDDHDDNDEEEVVVGEDEYYAYGEAVRDGSVMRDHYEHFSQLAGILDHNIPKYCERCKDPIGKNDRMFYNDTPFVKLNISLCIKCTTYWLDKGLIDLKEIKAVPKKEMFPYLKVKGSSSSENTNYYFQVLGTLFVNNVLLKEEMQNTRSFLKHNSLELMEYLISMHVHLVKELENINEELKIKLNELDTEESKLEEIDAQLEDSSSFSSAASVIDSVQASIASFVRLAKESNRTLVKNKWEMRWIKTRVAWINKDNLTTVWNSLIKAEKNVARRFKETSRR